MSLHRAPVWLACAMMASDVVSPHRSSRALNPWARLFFFVSPEMLECLAQEYFLHLTFGERASTSGTPTTPGRRAVVSIRCSTFSESSLAS